MTHEVSSWIEGPRWAKFPVALKKLAIALHIEIDLTVEKHLLMETVFFTARGAEADLLLFREALKEGVKDYNR